MAATEKLDPQMPFYLSRLVGKHLNPSHRAYDGVLPSTGVEVINSDNNFLLDHLRNNVNRRVTKVFNASSLVILVGDVKDAKTLEAATQIISSKNKHILYVPGPSGKKILEKYQIRSMYDWKGYKDFGLSYSYSHESAVASDVACFWDETNDTATVVVPHSPTLAGINKVATVMKKADIMISSHPPVDVADGDQSVIVSMAREIWEPKTHIYPDKGKGLILSSGSDRLIGLPSKGPNTVLRWASGDLARGPINSFQGYPVLRKATSTRRKRA